MSTPVKQIEQPAAPGWKISELYPFPKDRPIWVRANLVETDEAFTSVTPYEGYAKWSNEALQWLNIEGIAIGGYLETDFIKFDWMELSERAANCPASETNLSGNVYFWDQDWRLEEGSAGYFAIFYRYHTPTGIMLTNHTAGPFALQEMACRALLQFMLSTQEVA